MSFALIGPKAEITCRARSSARERMEVSLERRPGNVDCEAGVRFGATCSLRMSGGVATGGAAERIAAGDASESPALVPLTVAAVSVPFGDCTADLLPTP